MPEAGHQTVEEHAAAWLVRRDRGFSSEERALFEAWLAADNAHARAFDEAERLWTVLGRLPEPNIGPRKTPERWLVPAALAASLILAATVALDIPTRLSADMRTATGEIETRQLPDGSTVTLGTQTAIAVDFQGSRRRIRLLRGQAAFDVAPDPSRPFVVEADGGEATALGTRYAVRRDGSSMTVTVMESHVRVRHGSASADLGPGERVRFAQDGLDPVDKVDADAETAWTRGKLVFVDQPLAAVIDELNRYDRGTIRLIGRELENRRVSGIFDASDPIAAVDALEHSLGLRSLRVADMLIVLYR